MPEKNQSQHIQKKIGFTLQTIFKVHSSISTLIMFKFTDWPKSKPTKIKYQVTLYRSLWWMIRIIALIGCYSHKLVVGNLVTVISLEKVLLRLYQQKKSKENVTVTVIHFLAL